MILVTGTGRCGSSLMMQTLYYLGVPLIGDPQDNNSIDCLWHPMLYNDMDPKVIEELEERAMSFNPKGFWELSIEEIIELCHKGFSSEDLGGAIKIMGGLVSELKTEDIEKIILCKRKDSVRQAESMYDMAQVDMQITEENGLTGAWFTDWYKDKDYLDIMSMQTSQGYMIDNLATNYSIHSLCIYFEDILEDPEREIESIVHFLELEDMDITKAVENVDK